MVGEGGHRPGVLLRESSRVEAIPERIMCVMSVIPSWCSARAKEFVNSEFGKQPRQGAK